MERFQVLKASLWEIQSRWVWNFCSFQLNFKLAENARVVHLLSPWWQNPSRIHISDAKKCNFIRPIAFCIGAFVDGHESDYWRRRAAQREQTVNYRVECKQLTGICFQWQRDGVEAKASIIDSLSWFSIAMASLQTHFHLLFLSIKSAMTGFTHERVSAPHLPREHKLKIINFASNDEKRFFIFILWR